MSVSLAEWLKAADRDRDWFNALPKQAKDTVQQAAENFAPGETALNQPQIIASNIDEGNFQGFPEGEAPTPSSAPASSEAAPSPVASVEGVAPVVPSPEAQGPSAAPVVDLSRLQAFSTDSLLTQLQGIEFRLRRQQQTQLERAFEALSPQAQRFEREQGFAPEPSGSSTVETSQFISALWSGASKADIRDLQQKLERAGYLEEGTFIPGRMSQTVQDRILFAIKDAVKSEKPLFRWLNQRGESLDIARAKEEAKEKAEEARAKALAFAEQAENAYRSELLGTYMRLWGKPPPPGYIGSIAASKMNVFEFEGHERSKPAFESSPRFQGERLELEATLAERFGALG